MNHLWIAYDALLVAMGLANVVLLFWARDRKPFLGAFTGFYATFALSIAVALARRYVTFNVGSETWVTFLSYGVSTVLSYAVLAWSLRFYERFLDRSRSVVVRVLMVGLGIAAVVAVLPWSVTFTPDRQAYSLRAGHYVATAAYVAAFSYLMYLAVVAARRVEAGLDRWFAWALLSFAATGYVESLLGLVADLRSPVGDLGADGEQFLFSSVPYAAFSVFLACYLLRMIDPVATPSIVANPTQHSAKLEALGLSRREEDVFNLLLAGLSNKAIANGLNISEATVKTHLNKIFRKANVHSRLELVQTLK